MLSFFLLSLSVFHFLRFKQQNSSSSADLFATNHNPDEQGFLAEDQASKHCSHHRLNMHPTRDRHRRIYDLFLINTELDWLEIRLHELDKEVDFFVILESPFSFQHTPKPLHLQDELSQFDAFRHKIIYQVLDFTGEGTSIPDNKPWQQEIFTRNALLDQVIASLDDDRAPREGDVLLVSDIDEVPRPSTLITLRNCAFPPRTALRSNMYYYSFQWLHRGGQWDHPQATFFAGNDTVKPDTLRSHHPYDIELYNAAWHCSSCFATMSDLRNKITSFSHKEFNKPHMLKPERLLKVVRSGEDLFERSSELYDRVEDNPDVPGYLLREDNQKKFAYLLDRDPPDANFQDVFSIVAEKVELH